MAAEFSPGYVIYLADTLTNGGATAKASIALPAGSNFALATVTSTSNNAATTIAVSNGTSDALAATGINNTTATLPATDPTVAFTSVIEVTCGGGGALNDTVLVLNAVDGPTLTVTLSA